MSFLRDAQHFRETNYRVPSPRLAVQLSTLHPTMNRHDWEAKELCCFALTDEVVESRQAFVVEADLVTDDQHSLARHSALGRFFIHFRGVEDWEDRIQPESVHRVVSAGHVTPGVTVTRTLTFSAAAAQEAQGADNRCFAYQVSRQFGRTPSAIVAYRRLYAYERDSRTLVFHGGSGGASWSTPRHSTQMAERGRRGGACTR